MREISATEGRYHESALGMVDPPKMGWLRATMSLRDGNKATGAACMLNGTDAELVCRVDWSEEEPKSSQSERTRDRISSTENVIISRSLRIGIRLELF